MMSLNKVSVKAGQNPSGSTFAIKILNSQKTSRDKLRRFKNEVQFGIRNSHPNIIAISDHGLHDASPFYVMPLHSQTLRGLINGGLGTAKILPCFSQIMDGVEAAHIQGIVHRDLKPENVFHGGEGDRLVVADFGIASFEEEELYTAVETSNQERLANFQYAAPEQRRRGQVVDYRADIYALGLILNEMFTKEVPQGTEYRTIGSISAEYGYLDDLVAEMIRQNPTDRPSSIAKIKEQLIARHKDFISQQRLSALKNTVIRDSEIDDPLIADPMSLKAVDFLNGQLILTLSHQVNPNWEHAFRNMGGHRSIMGSGPDRFTFQGDLARVPVSGQYAEQTLNYFKEWLPVVNRRYEQIVRSERDEALAQERQKLQREIEREEERRRIVGRLQV